jgi:SAM-dependent methyltransferase
VSSDGDVRYMLPRHPCEIDRLDVQHYALLETLGANHLAPIEHPSRILDVGSGTGQWGSDLAADHPDALIVGFDLVAGKASRPPNYHTVHGNLLQGLPFVDGSFDFVHQRLMTTSAIPRTAWPAVVADLVRITALGGWIELVEVQVEIRPAGPASRKLFDLTRQVGRAAFGLDQEAIVSALDQPLREAGLVDVERRDVPTPVGEWGGRAGQLNASNLRALQARLSDLLVERGGVSRKELNRLVRAMPEEWEKHRSMATFVFAYGRRPA